MAAVIQVAKGVDGSPVRLVIQTFGPNGGYAPAAGMLDGTETLTCEVWPGGDRAVVATLPAELAGPDDDTPFDVNDPRALVSLPRTAYADLESGPYRARVMLADLSALLAEFEIELRDGPGSSAARPAYHTYKQLRDEYPFVDRFADHLHDETGFAEIAADVRDWIDAEILIAAAGQVDCWYRRATDYADAIAADGIDLTTPMGKRLVKVSVNKTLASIMRRVVGMSNAPESFDDAADFRDAEAEKLLRSLKVELPGYPAVNLGALRVGRLVR